MTTVTSKNIALPKAEEETVWIDALDPSPEELSSLQKTFSLHELAIEDVTGGFHLPKLDEYPNYLFIIWHALNDLPNTPQIEHTQINIFLGQNFIITIHVTANKDIDSIFNKCCDGQLTVGNGSDWLLLHTILDRFVDDYFPLIDSISNGIDDIEDAIFKKADSKQMRQLFNLKHKLAELKKIVAPQRDIVSQLSRFENKFISAEHLMYYRDIFDHLIRVLDLVDSSREVISGVVDIYMSSISNKMNEIMTRLTIVATIFLPLTLITGIYGMNFKHMPELETSYGYFIVWAIILVFGLGSYFYYRQKLKW